MAEDTSEQYSGLFADMKTVADNTTKMLAAGQKVEPGTNTVVSGFNKIINASTLDDGDRAMSFTLFVIDIFRTYVFSPPSLTDPLTSLNTPLSALNGLTKTGIGCVDQGKNEPSQFLGIRFGYNKLIHNLSFIQQAHVRFGSYHGTQRCRIGK